MSFEFVALCLGTLGWCLWLPTFDILASAIQMNDEVNKYLMLLPAVLAVWVFNEVRCLLQEDKDILRLLLKWEGYWTLKCHAWVSLFYSVIFVFVSLVPWISKAGIGTGEGLLLFFVAIVGQLLVAFSVYLARIKIKEIIVGAEQ
ncbi:hypothetical protein [Pseudomonas fluorescens]|uniref:hypothetical protein n=1 Tax=Pseudomonas fluorescens TaxID=294 RepID=UPI0012429270|nr:hypothetical protein [Pseudomonas fluorescens]